MAKKLGFRGAERDDLVQDVWLRVFKHLRTYDWQPRDSGLRGWLYRLLCNHARDVVRRRQRNRVVLASQGELEAIADVADTNDWQATCDGQLLEQLIGSLKMKVSPLSRRLLTMLWIDRRPRAEVAHTSQLTPEEIKYRQYRVFGKLRTALAVYRGEQFSAVH
jgi:RNA polymerase sigma factor (sigma-70 family)